MEFAWLKGLFGSGKKRSGWERHYTDTRGNEAWEQGTPLPSFGKSQLADELLKARLKIAELEGQLEALQVSGNAIARIQGRIFEIKGIFLQVIVQGSDEQWFRLAIQAPDPDDRNALSQGDNVELVCRIEAQGRYILQEIVSSEESDTALPEPVKAVQKGQHIPDWFEAKNAKKRLLKSSEHSSSVSDLKVHLVWATKRRGKVLTAPMVEMMKALAAEVVKAKSLGELLALNAEGDHVHAVLWLPNTVSASEAVRVLKANLSKGLRQAFPHLLKYDSEALWQRGFYAGAIGNGGDLSAVLDYVAGQRSPEGPAGVEEGGDADE